VKTTLLKQAGAAALLTAVAAAVAMPAHAAKKVRWKMHSAFPASQIIQGDRPKYVSDQVKAMSGGDFDMKIALMQPTVPADMSRAKILPMLTSLLSLSGRVLTNSMPSSSTAVVKSSRKAFTRKTIFTSHFAACLLLKLQAGSKKKLHHSTS